MEDASTTDATLALYRDLRAAGYDNVGVVLQSRLRRTLDDVAGLDDVRLCKGIYLEPEAIAFQDAEEVRASFVRCLEALLAQGSYVAIATHDERLIAEALRLDRRPRPRPRSVRVPDAARRDGPSSATSSSATATACASTSRSGRTGTSTRCAA